MAVQFHATKKELQRTGAIRLTRLPLPEGLAASSVLFLVHSPQVNHIESSNPLERSSTHPKALLAAPLTHPSSKTFRGTHAPQDPGQAERAHQAHGVGAFQVQGLRRPIHHGLEETEDHLGSEVTFDPDAESDGGWWTPGWRPTRGSFGLDHRPSCDATRPFFHAQRRVSHTVQNWKAGPDKGLLGTPPVPVHRDTTF